MSAAEVELVRVLRKLVRRAEIGGPVKKRHRPPTAGRGRPEKAEPLGPKPEVPTTPAVPEKPPETASNVIPFVPRDAAHEAWLARGGRGGKPLTGREWLSKQTRGSGAVGRGLQDKEW